MRPFTSAAAISAALFVAPAGAAADMADCPPKLEHRYTHSYKKVAKRLGTRAPGRNIRRHGVRFKGATFVTTCGEMRRSRRQLERLLVRPAYLSVGATRPQQPPAGVKTRSYAPTGLAACIVHYESGGDPNASNGSHFGIAQWTYEAWARHGGTKYSADPRGATYQQQLEILNQGLTVYGCRDWCPFDPC